MSVNRYREHLLILPEDEPYQEILVGFLENLDHQVSGQVQLLPRARGFERALAQVVNDEHQLGKYLLGRLLVVIDFDGIDDRRDYIAGRVPAGLVERVYFIGPFEESEDLRRALGSFHSIGETVCLACREQAAGPWSHPLLTHNQAEVARLAPIIQSQLFGR